MLSDEKIRERIEKEIRSLPTGKPNELYEPISYFLSLGGKRMRPILLIRACEMFGGTIQHAIKPAMGIELFHNFTLLHDDIMDRSPLRRGKATVNSRWNDHVAILSGDAMFVQSIQYIMQCNVKYQNEVMRVFLKNAIGVCEGQQFDMNFEKIDRVSESEYLHMIELKTAVLLGAALEVGAILGGASKKDRDLIYDFGKNIGIAFQLKDDLLDVFGDEKLFGKQKGRDIVSNKKTFLLIRAIKHSTGKNRTELMKWLKAKKFSEKDKVEAVAGIYEELGIRELTQKEINRFYTKGINSLKKINIPDSRKKYLQEFALQLQERQR